MTSTKNQSSHHTESLKSQKKFVPLQLDRRRSIQTFWKIKKRYAYLELENVGNFQQYSKIWHGGFPRIAWAAVTTSEYKGFLRPSSLDAA